MRRALAVALAVVAAGGGSWLYGPSADAVDPGVCGTTTLDAVIADTDGDGILECAPGEPLIVREDLAPASSTRAGARSPLTAFFSIADIQLADEESPLRGEWADKCDEHPFTSAFRPQEALVPHLMNAHIRAANRIAAAGSPVLGLPFDFAAALGDLADNQQRNEVQDVIDIFDGGLLVDPDTGGDGYEGVQAEDPSGRGDLAAPVAATATLPLTQRDKPILNLANEPFFAPGLRNPDGSAVPWYSIPGNHDSKTQGTIKDDIPGWREFVRFWAVGAIKVMDLAPDRQQEICAALASGDPSVLAKFMADPTAGMTKVVTPDQDRIPINKQEWIDEHLFSKGLPDGHGFGAGSRVCPDVYPDDFSRRACFAFDHGPFRFIALDSNPAEGFEEGNIDAEQFAWLESELKGASTSYFENGAAVTNPSATDRLVVVFTHHTTSSLFNRETSNNPLSTAKHGDDLEALLLSFPNVIMHGNGHTHENKIIPHRSAALGTAYWEVNTAAIVDWPNHSRTIEVADNGDGTLSIFAVIFDAAVAPDARGIPWGADTTPEAALGAARNINEDWLAAAGLETAYHDPQSGVPGKRGGPGDRNVELIIPAPFSLSP